MSIFISYVAIGLAIAMPIIGAITVEMMKQGLKNGFLHGWAVGLGGMLIDVLLILALYFGLANILALPYVQLPLWLIGAGFLFMLAYDSIKHASDNITLAGEAVTTSWWHTFRNSLFVAISPGNLVFWISVFGAALTGSYAKDGDGAFLLAAAGILTGILLHDIGLLTIVSLTRKVMSRSMIRLASIIAGIALIGFACYFLYKFFIALRVYV